VAYTLDFTGQIILVTGATRGIGKAIAHAFHAAGGTVWLTGTNPEQIDALNREASIKGIERLHYIAVDFTKDDSIEQFVQLLDSMERIDVVVNNAGTNRINLVENTSLEDYDFLESINLRTPYRICQAVVPKMKAAAYGRIINVASIWSVITKPGRSIYTTTKFGLVGLTKTLAVELAASNIMVNAVSPGFTLTELTRATLTSAEIDVLAQQVPARRFAEPEEIAQIVLFLSSTLNTYLTGQNIVVDGGFVSI